MDPSKQALEILEVLQRYRRIRVSHKNHNHSIEPFIGLVVPFIEKKLPFKMLLPAFHCKSINPDSVLGTTPDGAEEEAIFTLEQLCKEVQNVYSHGCELFIVHEGHFYSDIHITPSDDVIDTYENAIHQMTQSPHILYSNLMQEYSDSYDTARKILFDKYMPTMEEVGALIKTDASIKDKYVAYKAFIANEFVPVLMVGCTKREIRDRSKVLAYQWVQRYLVFKKLCTERFADYFRFSVLCYPSKSRSFSINLIMNTSECGLPWFHVLVKRSDGSMELIKKTEAERRGYQLVYIEGEPWYYIEKQS